MKTPITPNMIPYLGVFVRCEQSLLLQLEGFADSGMSFGKATLGLEGSGLLGSEVTHVSRLENPTPHKSGLFPY
jgi:hypothetical protein